MKKQTDVKKFKPVQLKSAGFGRRWQTKRTDLDGAIHKGIKASVQALEDSKKKISMIGFRPDSLFVESSE